MSLGGLIPIGTNSTNGKQLKMTSSELTGGLISITSSKSSRTLQNDEINEFNMDDLLGDGVIPIKKKKDSHKEKSKSHKSKSKHKKKEKDEINWEDLLEKDTVNSEETNDLPGKGVKMGKKTNFDDEFAKLLGLDDDVMSSKAVYEEDELKEDIKATVAPVEEEIEMKDISRISLKKEYDSVPLNTTDRIRSNIENDFGISASFFDEDSEITIDKESKSNRFSRDNSLEPWSTSMVATTTLPVHNQGEQQTSRRRNGRRQKLDTSESFLIDLFADQQHKRDPTSAHEANKANVLIESQPSQHSLGNDDFIPKMFKSSDKSTANKSTESIEKSDKEKNLSKPAKSVTQSPQISFVSQDDLLAELFPNEKDELLFIGGIDNILSENQLNPLSPSIITEKPISNSETVVLNEIAESKSNSKHIEKSFDEHCNQKFQPSKNSQNTIIPAKDSLLEDLLDEKTFKTTAIFNIQEASIPMQRQPEGIESVYSKNEPKHLINHLPHQQVEVKSEMGRQNEYETAASSTSQQHRLPKTNSPYASPLKESLAQSENFASIFQEPPNIQKASLPPQSPGKSKTVATPSKEAIIREEEFEHGKNDLIDEILTPSPPRSPRHSVNKSRVPDNGSGSPISSSLQSTITNNTLRQHSPFLMENRHPTLKRQQSLPLDFSVEICNETRPSPNASPKVTTVRPKHVLQHELEQLSNKLQIEAQRNEAIEKKWVKQVEEINIHVNEKEKLQSKLRLLQDQSKNENMLLNERIQMLEQELRLKSEETKHLQQQLFTEQNNYRDCHARLLCLQTELETKLENNRQRDTDRIEKLFRQLQSTLTSINVLHDQRADEGRLKKDIEAESRYRMIMSLESTSKSYANASEQECVRLNSLLRDMESTLRYYRSQHVEENERLRHEQSRLSILAEHFQAQSQVLISKSDANAQELNKFLTQCFQDSRAVEARIQVKRDMLENDIRKFHEERSQFAQYREDTLSSISREKQEFDLKKDYASKELKRIENEKLKLHELMKSHTDERERIESIKAAINNEKEKIASKTSEVANVAKRVGQLSAMLVEKEKLMSDERTKWTKYENEQEAMKVNLTNKAMALERWEKRLHQQLLHIQKIQWQHQSDRTKVHIEKRSRVHRPSVKDPGNNQIWHDQQKYFPKVMANNSNLRTVSNINWNTPISSNANISEFLHYDDDVILKNNDIEMLLNSNNRVCTDPSGLSPSFRQLIEANWKKHGHD